MATEAEIQEPISVSKREEESQYLTSLTTRSFGDSSVNFGENEGLEEKILDQLAEVIAAKDAPSEEGPEAIDAKDSASIDVSSVNETAPTVEEKLDLVPSITSRDKQATAESSDKMKSLDENKQSDAAAKVINNDDSLVEVKSSISIIDENVENFKIKNLPEATPILSGEDKDCKGEDADERNNDITEEEMQDGPEIMCPTEATKEIIKDNDMLPLPKLTEGERFESFKDGENKAEKSKLEDEDTECVTADGQNKDPRPESAEEVSDQNFQVDEKDADKFEGEKIEKSEAAAGESIASEASQTAESPQEMLNTLMMRQEYNLQIEDESTTATEALPEEKGNDNEQAETEGPIQKKILENEDSKISQESEPGEKLEHSLHLTSADTERIPSEADEIPCLVEGVLQNPGETLEEEVTGEADNNIIEDNGTIKEDLKLDARTSDASKGKESMISEKETKVGNMEVEACTEAYNPDSEEKPERGDGLNIEVNTKKEEAEEVHEDAKIDDKEEDKGQSIINDESHIGDGSPESVGEESQESHQEVKTEEKMPEVEVRKLETTNTSEDAEKQTFEEREEEISKHQSTLLAAKVEEGSKEENIVQIMTEKEENQATHEGEDIDTHKTEDGSSKAGDNFEVPAIKTDKEQSLNKENREREPENKSEEQIETTSSVSLSKEQKSEAAVSILEDGSPEDSSDTKKTEEICSIQKEPQELEGDRKDETAAAQSVLVEELKEQIPASSTLPSEEPEHGTTNKVDGMEEERVNEDEGPIEVEGVAEREVIAGSTLPADESEEIRNIKSVEKEAEKLEDESHEDSCMAVVQHELTDSQIFSEEKTKQQVQEEKHEAMIIARIEDDKEGAEIIKDDSANSNTMKDLCLQKDSIEPETVEENEITADQTSMEEKSGEQSQSAISASPSNEQKCDDATKVENTGGQVFSAEESEQQVQEEKHEAAIISKMLEDNKKEETTTIDDNIAEDAKDSKTMEDLCKQKEPTEPKAVTEDEITADQAPVEKKAEEHIQIATSALPSSSEQECEGATEVENTDGKTFSAEKSEQLVQEKEHEAGIIGEKIEGTKIEGAETIEHESTKDASDSNTMTDLSQQKDSTEPEAVIENETTADQTLTEEKSEEQIQNAISALPSKDQEFEGATTAENTDGQTFPAVKSEQQVQEEHEAVIIAKKIEDDKKAGAEVLEVESAGDASDSKTMEDLCPQKESTKSEAVIENEITADQTVVKEKSEEEIQMTTSSVSHSKEQDSETAVSIEKTGDEKTVDTGILEDGSPEDSSDTNKTEEICSIQEEPQELEGDRKDETAAAQSLLVKESKEQIPASSTLPSEEPEHGTTTKVDGMEEERVNEDAGPIEVEGVAEREVIAGPILPADRSEEIRNTESVEKEAEKLEDESHEDSSVAVVQHELMDSQTFSEEKTKQQVQEEEHEARIIAKIEDDKEGAEIIEDDSANSNTMKDLCLQKDSTEPETVEENEIAADQTSIEKNSEEQSQSAISASPSNEQKCDDATKVENTGSQVFSAEESEQQVQEEAHEAVIISKMLEDNKKEETTTIDDNSAEDAKDSKTMEDLCKQKEPTEPKAVTEDEITADQAPVEKKAEDHIQIAISALSSSSEQESEGATKVENTDGKTFSAEKSEQLVQEKELEAGIIGEKIEGDKIEGAETIEHESTKDASESNTMTDLSQQKESTEPEAVIENETTADQTLTKEKSEEQIQNAISALPSQDQEFEGATTVENTDGKTFPAVKSEQQVQEENEAVIIAKKIEDDKKAGAEVIEGETAGDASDSKIMEDLCPQKESTKSEAVIEKEITADQTVVEEKSEEEIQTANSSLPPKEVEVEGATTVENIEEDKEKETEILEDENQENSVDAKRAEDVHLEKGKLQEFEAVVKKDEITSQKKEEELIEDESAGDAKTMRDLCPQTESTELEAALDDKSTIDQTAVEEKPEEQVQIATYALPSEEQECEGAIIVENIEEEKTKEAEILEQDIRLQKERLQVSEAVRQDEIESAQALLIESTEQQLKTPSFTLPSEEEEHGTTTEVNKIEEETMEEEEILEKDSSAGKPEDKGADDMSLANERLQELEGVRKDEVAIAQTPMKGLEEQLQAASSKLVPEEEEQGTKTGNEKMVEEKPKEVEMLEREYSAAKSTEEKHSEKEGPKEVEDVMNEAIIADQTLPAEESQELATKRAVQKLQELNIKEAEKLEDEICENASDGTKTKEMCLQMEEPSKLQHVAKDEIAAGHTFSTEHSEELQISAPVVSSEDIGKTIEGEEPKRDGDSIEKITEDKEVAQTMKASDQEDQPKDGFLGAEENNATFKTTTKEAQTEEMSVEIQKVDAKNNAEKILAEDRGLKETDNTSSVAMAETTTIREEESGVALSQKESSAKKTANELSEKQTPREVGTGEIALLEKQDREAETLKKGEVIGDLEPGNAREIYSEIKEFEQGGEKKSCKPDDLAIQEVTLSDFHEKSRKETPPVAKEMRTTTRSKEKPQVEEAEEEEGNKQGRVDWDPDSRIMGEALRESIVKAPQKKSHNILSGVGSKVKHSISKVRKALTCASPSPKVVDPKLRNQMNASKEKSQNN